VDLFDNPIVARTEYMKTNFTKGLIHANSADLASGEGVTDDIVQYMITAKGANAILLAIFGDDDLGVEYVDYTPDSFSQDQLSTETYTAIVMEDHFWPLQIPTDGITVTNDLADHDRDLEDHFLEAACLTTGQIRLQEAIKSRLPHEARWLSRLTDMIDNLVAVKNASSGYDVGPIDFSKSAVVCIYHSASDMILSDEEQQAVEETWSDAYDAAVEATGYDEVAEKRESSRRADRINQALGYGLVNDISKAA